MAIEVSASTAGAAFTDGSGPTGGAALISDVTLLCVAIACVRGL